MIETVAPGAGILDVPESRFISCHSKKISEIRKGEGQRVVAIGRDIGQLRCRGGKTECWYRESRRDGRVGRRSQHRKGARIGAVGCRTWCRTARIARVSVCVGLLRNGLEGGSKAASSARSQSRRRSRVVRRFAPHLHRPVALCIARKKKYARQDSNLQPLGSEDFPDHPNALLMLAKALVFQGTCFALALPMRC